MTQERLKNGPFGQSVGVGCFPVKTRNDSKASINVYEVPGGINTAVHWGSENCKNDGINHSHIKLPSTFFHESCTKVRAGWATFYSRRNKNSHLPFLTGLWSVNHVVFWDHLPNKCETPFIYSSYGVTGFCSKEWNFKFVFDDGQLKYLNYTEGNCSGRYVKALVSTATAECEQVSPCDTVNQTIDCPVHQQILDHRKLDDLMSNAMLSYKHDGILVAAHVVFIFTTMLMR